MIVQCAECKTRYRLDPARVPMQRIRVRCAQCSAVFPVDGTRREPQRTSGAAPTIVRSAVSSASIPRVERAAPKPPPQRPTPSAATSVRASGSVGYGYREIDLGPASERKGVSGAVAAAAPPASGVDAMPDLDLEIERSTGPAPRTPTAPAHPGAVQRSAAARTVEAPAQRGFVEVDLDPQSPKTAEPAGDPALQKEYEKARRLARALVSDILVYNREKRDKALADGTLVQALGHEIKKSWELYKEKVTPEVANNTNHFREALNEILADGQPIF